MNYAEFSYYNKVSLNSGLIGRVTIEDRKFKENTCKILGNTASIDSVVQNVMSQKYCLTNASQLTLWKGFREKGNQNNQKKPSKELKKKELYQTVAKIEDDYVPFDVVFKPKDGGQDEIYSYNNKKDAVKHLELFIDDDSGIYRTIALVNVNKNDVYRVLYFEGDSDVCTLDASKYDIVRIKRRFWNSPKEGNLLYAVKHINDISCSCVIDLLDSHMALGSSENVGLEMIQNTGHNLSEYSK